MWRLPVTYNLIMHEIIAPPSVAQPTEIHGFHIHDNSNKVEPLGRGHRLSSGANQDPTFLPCRLAVAARAFRAEARWGALCLAGVKPQQRKGEIVGTEKQLVIGLSKQQNI